ncbi:uncharacterized protein EV420DRAFT_1166560 [Desarmillaria tabescens]|uniref:Uncharacterized protein n=1 Tax=Armillaria tabescens TaxID=1929756 RepID=A0AA39JC31_ARMTA|nr:uncharacterized protein EV420DRAFT_1166560 [Desarmillaria tabescens]KAK0440002.1 hypothetical protein EV420DRAFT_1166560 [Desarmillaria tabescens]
MDPECTIHERALRQYSSCSNAYFCNLVCQRIAWRLGYKKSCHEQQDERRAGYVKRITDRDISFYAVAGYDIVNNSIIGKLQTYFLKKNRASPTSLLHSQIYRPMREQGTLETSGGRFEGTERAPGVYQGSKRIESLHLFSDFSWVLLQPKNVLDIQPVATHYNALISATYQHLHSI